MQATVSQFDPTTRTGTVLLDDGVQLRFSRAAFDAGGLRTVRFGQRVRLELDEATDTAGTRDTDNTDDAPATRGAPRIREVWLATIHPLV